MHLHTHGTTGGQLAALTAAIEADVDAVDTASAVLAGTTSQPSLSALLAATDRSSRETGLSIDAVNALEPYWEAVRRLYAPFKSGLPAPTGHVYRHEIPGGQLSNLRHQAVALRLGEKFEQIKDMYAATNDILGNVVKVTPSSKVVGDLALGLVAAGADPAEYEADPSRFDVPDSVIGFLSGDLGDPPGRWPGPFRTRALAGRDVKPRQESLTEEQEKGPRHRSSTHAQPASVPQANGRVRGGAGAVRRRVGNCRPLRSSSASSPRPKSRCTSARATSCSSVSRQSESPTPDARGMRTVVGTINGQLRPTLVRDQSADSTAVSAEKTDPGDPTQVAAPFAGAMTPLVADGDTVESGQTMATIEAMKMEASITAPSAGTVQRLAVESTRRTAGGGRRAAGGGRRPTPSPRSGLRAG